VLKDVGDTLRSGLRRGNFPARIGAAGFAVLLADTDFAAAMTVYPAPGRDLGEQDEEE